MPRRFLRWGIRAQLLILVAGALLPLIAFVAWTLYEQHTESHAQLHQEVRAHAHDLRDEIDNHLHFAEGVLASLAPLALRSQGALQRSELDEVMRHLPPYATNIMAFDAKGRLVSSHAEASEGIRTRGIAERPYFGAALKSPGTAVTDSVIGRTSGKRLATTALAYRDASGAVAGVLVFTTNLPVYEKRVLDSVAGRTATVAVLDSQAGVVMRSSGPAAIEPGRAPFTLEILRQRELDGELDRGDRQHVFGTARTLRAPWTIVVVGGDHDAQLLGSRLTATLAAAFLALALGLIAAGWISRRITAPLGNLREAADTFARGELRHRVPMLAGDAGAVGRAFNVMAEQLEAQRTTIRADAERFRAVFHNCPLPMGISDMASGRIVEVNAAFTEITGIPANDAIGKTSGQIQVWVDPEQRANALRLVEQNGRIEAFECRHRMRSGKVLDLLLFAEALDVGGRRMILSQAVDVTERKRAERQLRDVSKRLRLATRSARIGIWDLDLRTGKIEWDDPMFDLYGITPREFGGRLEDWLRRVHVMDRGEVEKCRAQALAARAEVDIQYRIIAADGAIRHVRSSASVERDENGEPVRLMGTSVDVTESVVGRERLARMNSELEARVVERTGELQETVRELEAFSYTVAHDLRAPLRAIDGFSSCLGQAIDPAQGAGASSLISKIRRNVGSMDRLIDGLLNYARLGRQDIRGVPIDMTQLANSVAASVSESYPGVEITIDSMPGAFGDSQMLAQVWTNLIGNACKFSSGHGTPRVAVGSTTDAQGTVYFVWDNGVGFDMRYADHLFRVFERLHNDPEFGGTGVGLAVVQRVVQRHAGAVWAEGFPGEGATFYFRLPDRAAAAAA